MLSALVESTTPLGVCPILCWCLRFVYAMNFFLKVGCDSLMFTFRLSVRRHLIAIAYKHMWPNALLSSCRENTLQHLQFKESLRIAVAMMWCTQV